MGWNYISMRGLKFNHVSKCDTRILDKFVEASLIPFGNVMSQGHQNVLVIPCQNHQSWFSLATCHSNKESNVNQYQEPRSVNGTFLWFHCKQCHRFDGYGDYKVLKRKHLYGNESGNFLFINLLHCTLGAKINTTGMYIIRKTWLIDITPVSESG